MLHTTVYRKALRLVDFHNIASVGVPVLNQVKTFTLDSKFEDVCQESVRFEVL